MTRGNQRELSRQKGNKKQAEMEKSKKISEKGNNVGLTTEQRRLRDAQALQEKQRLKQEGLDKNKAKV